MVEKLLEKNPNNLFLQFLANKKVIYALYLIIWVLIVLALYFLFIKPSASVNKPEDKDNKLTYADFKEIIQGNNYSYNYVILDGDVKIIYKGDRLLNEEVGYMENINNISKYYIKDGIYYDVVAFNPIANDANPMYDSYLDSSFLISTLDSITPEVNDNIYIFKKDSFYGKIDLSKKDDITVEIEESVIKYSLEYTNIGGVYSINY